MCAQKLAGDLLNLPHEDKTKQYNDKDYNKNIAVEEL